MVIICSRTSEIPQKGESPVRIESLLRGVVLQNDGDRMMFDVTYTQRNAEESIPFRTEKYRLTTELEATRQKMARLHQLPCQICYRVSDPAGSGIPGCTGDALHTLMTMVT